MGLNPNLLKQSVIQQQNNVIVNTVDLKLMKIYPILAPST